MPFPSTQLQRITGILSSNLSPHSSGYPSPQFQQTFPGNPPAKPSREGNRRARHVGKLKTIILPSLLHVQCPSFIPSSVADYLLWLLFTFCPSFTGNRADQGGTLEETAYSPWWGGGYLHMNVWGHATMETTFAWESNWRLSESIKIGDTDTVSQSKTATYGE